jgi:hypothetical protein
MESRWGTLLQLTGWTGDTSPSPYETALRPQKEVSHMVGISHCYILLFFCPAPLACVNQAFLLLASEGDHYQQLCEQNVYTLLYESAGNCTKSGDVLV